MNVSYGPPGLKGVTHLVAIGDYEHELAPIGSIGELLDTRVNVSVVAALAIGAGIVGYLIGRRRARARR
jgi:hypothetical protein